MIKRTLKNIEELQILQIIILFQNGPFCQNQKVSFYIIPNCIKNHHTEIEIDRTILTCLN